MARAAFKGLTGSDRQGGGGARGGGGKTRETTLLFVCFFLSPPRPPRRDGGSRVAKGEKKAAREERFPLILGLCWLLAYFWEYHPGMGSIYGRSFLFFFKPVFFYCYYTCHYIFQPVYDGRRGFSLWRRASSTATNSNDFLVRSVMWGYVSYRKTANWNSVDRDEILRRNPADCGERGREGERETQTDRAGKAGHGAYQCQRV